MISLCVMGDYRSLDIFEDSRPEDVPFLHEHFSNVAEEWNNGRRLLQGQIPRPSGVTGTTKFPDANYLCYTDIEAIVNCDSVEDRAKLQSYDKVCFNVMERLHELSDWVTAHTSDIAQTGLTFATSVTRKLQEKCISMAEEYAEKLIENVSDPALKALNAYAVLSANQCLAYSELALRVDDHEALTLLADIWDHSYGDLKEQNDACGRLVTIVNDDMMSERFSKNVQLRETLSLNGEVQFFEVTDHPYGDKMNEIMSVITENTAIVRSLEFPDTTAGVVLAWLGSATTTGLIAAVCNSFKASF